MKSTKQLAEFLKALRVETKALKQNVDSTKNLDFSQIIWSEQFWTEKAKMEFQFPNAEQIKYLVDGKLTKLPNLELVGLDIA